MTAPSHSVPRQRATDEVYDERNNFLYLVLGVISVAERTLALLTELGEEDAIRDPDAPAARPVHPGPLLR